MTGGGLAADGATDTHYTLVASADWMYPGPAAKVVNSSVWPIPPWMANGPTSKWIAPRADTGTPNYNMAGNYTYRTTFDLTGMNPATAQLTGQWAVDNTGTMKLNGANVSVANGFSGWSGFTITTGFVAGINTIDFVVENGYGGESPTGLRVQITGTVMTAGSGNLFTNYTYDIYNRLTTVIMTRSSGSQTRRFNYDGTSQRLMSVANPENGTTSFTYNPDGTVATRLDAKQNRFEYFYDGKQRVIQVKRFPGPSGATEDQCQRVDYSYDTNPYDGAYTQYALGRPTAARWGGAGCAGGYTFTEMYTYTQAGRVTKKKLSPGSTFGTGGLESVQTYDNEGRMVTVKYPNTNNSSGGVITGPTYAYSFDAIARPSGMTENVTQPMVQSVAYNAASQITSMQYLQYVGGPTWLTETRQYNERLQMSLQTVAPSGGGAALMDLRYNYHATQNNGRIESMQDLVSGETVTYQYDELQRLTSASTATWGNSYTFDGFGNLLSKNVTGGSAPSLSINVDGNTNRITTGGYGYDPNGNLTTLPGVTGIAYDADNRLTAANNEQYGYAPSNQRVWLRKSGGAVEHFTFYGVDGARLGVYSKGTYNLPLTGSYFAVVKQEVYFAGKRIRSGNLAVAEDRLGSTRREDTTASRFYPYGEEFTPTTAEDRQKFGTYYRDAGTQLDYANQRYYSASIGRFLTADPGPAEQGNPQSWNRYSYAWNDPANLNDPDGMLPANVVSDSGCVPGPFMAPGGAVDASNPCPPGQVWVGFGGGAGGSKSRLRQVWEIFSPLSGFIADWDYANANGTRFDITLSASAYGPWIESLTATEVESIVKRFPPQWQFGVYTITITIYGAYRLYEWISARPVPVKAPFDPIEEVTRKGTPWRSVGGPSEFTWDADCPPGSPRHYRSLHWDPNHPVKGSHWDYVDCDGKSWTIWPDGNMTPAKK